jgi:CheY-like chemotaxis protein
MPYGVDLVWAVDGALGVQAWREGRYDLVLMDMQMPVMDGLTATRAIREAEALEPARGRTPIAMLSANAMEHHRQESIAAGADVHISKPVTPASLIAGIQAALAVGVPASSADAA